MDSTWCLSTNSRARFPKTRLVVCGHFLRPNMPIYGRIDKPWEHGPEIIERKKNINWDKEKQILKVSKSRKNFIVSSILPNSERNSLF